MGVKKLPTVKSLQVEFAELLSAKKTAYADLKKLRDEMRELSIHKANYAREHGISHVSVLETVEAIRKKYKKYFS